MPSPFSLACSPRLRHTQTHRDEGDGDDDDEEDENDENDAFLKEREREREGDRYHGLNIFPFFHINPKHFEALFRVLNFQKKKERIF